MCQAGLILPSLIVAIILRIATFSKYADINVDNGT